MNGAVKIEQVNCDVSASWVRIGPVAGILAIAAYFAAAMGNLPSRVTLVLAFAMGHLLSVAFIGFYHFLRAHRNSAALQTRSPLAFRLLFRPARLFALGRGVQLQETGIPVRSIPGSVAAM